MPESLESEVSDTGNVIEFPDAVAPPRYDDPVESPERINPASFPETVSEKFATMASIFPLLLASEVLMRITCGAA